MLKDKFILKTYKTESPIRYGTNDSGTLSFGQDNGRVDAMIREEIQNSLDARYSEGADKVTTVKFEIFDMETKDIPCYKDFKEEVKRCNTFWKTRIKRNTASIEALKNIEKILEGEKITVLHFADFNDKGLWGVNKVSTPFDNLIKARGVSDKVAGTGGSFGLGKDAALSLSAIRTIFYASVTDEDDPYAIGIAKFPGYEYEGKNYTGDIFFSDEHSNPVTFKTFGKFKRKYNQCGLDKYIFAVDDKIENDFEEKLVTSVIKNFLISIYNEKLIVEYKGVVLSKKTLEKYINKYRDTIDPIALLQYETIINPTEITHATIFEENDVQIYFRNNDENGSRKVGVYRLNGMKIFDKGNFPTGVNFDAVIVLSGVEVNDYFKQFENPEHNKWLRELIDKTKGANTNHKKLFEPIHRIINEIKKAKYSDNLTIDGLEDYLPMYYKDIEKKKDKTKEKLSNKIKNDKSKKPKVVKPIKKSYNFKTKDGKTIEAEIIEEETKISKGKVLVKIYDSENEPEEKEMTVEEFKNFKKENQVEKAPPKKTVKELSDTDVETNTFCENDIYHLFISPNKNIKNGYIEIKIVGETDSFDTTITSAQIDGKNVLSDNKILISEIKKGIPVRIDFTLDETERFTTEVYVYET